MLKFLKRFSTLKPGALIVHLVCYSLFIFISLSSFTTSTLYAQVTVAGSTGADGDFTTLKLAFDAINSNTDQAGNDISLSISANTVETASAVLNQPLVSSWNSLTIAPVGGAARTITGDLTTPLIDLNGADNVVINGLNFGGNTLTISNSNTTSNINPAIRFINDASYNTIQNCIITGSTILVTNGVILFSTGIATGNDGNTINNCTISAAGGNLPVNSIYSTGSSLTVDNSNNVISNNNIQDYFSAGLASNGILIATNSSAWTILGNKFFQTATRTATVGNAHRAIKIVTAGGINYTVSNNIIGYANASGTGVTTYNGTFANIFRAIELTVGTTIASNVQGNTIAGISLSTTSASALPGVFSGISVLGGSVNIGTSTANTIGATTGTGFISITSATTAGVITGIYSTSIGTVNIQNNNIGSISTGGTAAIGYTFHGIYTAGAFGNYSITSNTIGSTSTANSIAIGIKGTTTTGICTFNGINNAATGNISITGNTVQNVSVFGTGASVFNGIINAGGTGTLGITSNNIILGTNSGTGAMTGISNSAAVTSLNLNDNLIRGHSRTTITGTFTGITNTGVVTTAVNINNNQLGNSDGGLVTYSAANSSALAGISNTKGSAAAALSITGNDFRGIVHTLAGSSVHTYISNTAVTLSQNISSNTFTNLNVNTTGGVTFISNSVALFSNGTQNINNNSIVTAFNKGGAGGTVILYTSIGISAAGAVVNHTGNNFSNITVTGTTTITGWSNTGVGNSTQTITGNTFSNWTGGTAAITGMSINGFGGTSSVSNNTVSTISGQAAITGLIIGAAGTATTLTVSGNQINNLTSSGTGGAVLGLTSSNISPLVTISTNTIHTLSSSMSYGSSSTAIAVAGIYVSAATQANISSNNTYNFSTSGSTTSTGTLAIYGIYSVSTGTVSLQENNVYGVSTAGNASSKYTFIGMYTSGATGNFTISENTIGTSSPNSIVVGTNALTTAACTIIGISNAATGTISITNNTVQNATLNSTGASVLTGISNTGGSGTLTITGNNILKGTNNGTGAFTGILNTAGVSTADINSNVIRSHTRTAVTGTFTAISSAGTTAVVANILNINNNQLGNADGGLVTYTVANSSALVGINVANASATCALSIQSNDIRGITHSVVGTSTHTYIINAAATLSQNISSNTFTNLDVNTTGAIIFISNSVAVQSAGTQDVNGNAIVGTFTRTSSSASGALTLFTSALSSASGGVINNNNNNFSNITVSGAATIAGWLNTDAGNGTKTIQGNTFSNWNGGTGTIVAMNINLTSANNSTTNNAINTITSVGNITGIITGAGNDNIFQNTIHTLISTGTVATTITGIEITAGTNNNIYRNKIYNLRSNGPITTGTVNGILVSGAIASVTSNIYNNIIGNLVVPAGNGADLIRGISITATGVSSNINVYYNTVYLNASSTGTNFGTSGVYHTASGTVTTATLDLRNNIIINNSVSKGTSLTVAFRRSGVNLQNYASTSNNNLFLGTNLMHNGTAYTTLAAFKAAVSPRDAASISEVPNWLSTVGANANYLHINPAIQSQLESGGSNIALFTNDFDDDTRHGNAGYSGSGTAPDIGADEFNGSPNDITAPSISYALLTDNSCLATQTLTATITDGTGVNTTAGTKPRIYYKKSTNSNDLTATGWKYVEAINASSPFIFTIDHSLIPGGVATGNTIQYFVVAQDNLSTPLVGINNGTFAATPASVALTSAAFPIGATINSYKIMQSGLNADVTVGTSGNYPTLTGPGGLFADINAKGLSNNITANIISDITEPGTNSLNVIAYGCSDNYTLTISPSGGAARTLTGSINAPLLNFNGADNVIIDGLNLLTIENTSTAATAGTSTIRFIGDASNNIIRNCTIAGSSTLISTGTIFFSTGTTTGNDGNIITGCNITAAGGSLPFNAIYSAGSSVNVDNSSISITNNSIQDYYNPIGASNGVYVASNSSAWTITGNKFFQSGTRTATASVKSPYNIHRAINIITASGGGYTISSNTIGYSAVDATGVTVYDGNFANRFVGIEISAALTPVSSIQGNNIKAISLTTSNNLATAPGIFTGISVLAGNVNIGDIAGNTIGAASGTGLISITSSSSLGYIAGIYAISTGNVNIQNNNIGAISTGGGATIGYTFHGINTAGAFGNYSIASNTIGSTSTSNSIAIGTSGVTTAVTTFNGIYNLATGSISITGNTLQNVSVNSAGASVFNGIINTGGTGTLEIISNNIVSGTNTGTGAMTGISNSAAATTLNINNNVIRGHKRTAITGVFTGIANTGAVTTAINLTNNQLGISGSGLVNFSAATSSALTGITNATGAMAAAALTITGNDFQGITHSAQGASAHIYIINSAITLSQNISNNTFTDLNVNTTGNVIFISNNVALFSNGTQNINNNSIVTAFNKAGAGGIVTLFSSTAILPLGAVVIHTGNNFSKITVTGATTIAGWSITGTGKPTQTITENTFINWAGGTAAITGMSINGFGGISSVSENIISAISGQAAITGLVIGAAGTATSLTITDNNINNLVSSGTGGLVTGLSSANISPLVNIDLNTINTLASSFNAKTASIQGILVTAATQTNITNNTIHTLSASGTSIPIINGISAATINNINLQNNNIYGVTTTGVAASGYTFNGILTSGTAGNFIITENTIGASSPNSIALGTDGVSTGLSTISGIKNSASGTISITNNTVQNATLYGLGASVFAGISNVGASGTLDIIGNNILSGTNNGTGAFTGILNSAAVATANINDNIIRSHVRNANGIFTAISSAGTSAVVANVLNIENNQLGNADGGLVTYTVANSAALVGINVANASATCALSIQSNDIRGITSASSASQAQTYIINAAATLSQDISYNTFTELDVKTTGAIIFISNNVAAQSAGTQTINNNSIVGSFVRNSASVSGGLTLFTSSASSAAGAVIKNNNNNFSNITVSGIATIAGWINTDAGSGSNTIQENTFNNWNGGTGAIVALTVNQTGTNNATTNNTINTITSTGNITGITTAAGNDNIYSNTIYGLISNGTVGAIVNGIAITAGVTNNIYQNTIYNLQANNITTGSVNGISVSGGNTNNISRNKIYDISSSSSVITTGKVNGISVSGTTVSLTTNINNNIIGDLKATDASGTDLIRGIGITAAGTNSNINVYYNTVYLDAETTSLQDFGTSAIFHTSNTTATTAVLDMRNNIIVNNSQFNGAGTAVAFRRNLGTAGLLANYASTSNNNLFYSGEPSASRLIYSDVSSVAQTLADYKTGVFTAGTIAPRDNVSITESPNWVSTIGADDTYLHIRTDIATQIEGGAVNIAGISTDFDGEIRQGNSGYSGSGSAPDIGADEFNGGLPTLTWDGGAGTNKWSDALNWIYDYVPTALHSVVLDGAYTIDMDLNATVINLLISYPDLSLTIQANKTLTVSGNLTVSNGTLNTEAAFPTVTGSIDVSEGTIGYTGSGTSQSVSIQTYKNLTIENTAGVTASDNITVNGILSLTSNPSSTQGCLDMGTNTLTMGASATTIGVGDVTGIISRNSFVPGVEYSFGNKYSTTTFPTPASGASLPTKWSYKVAIGEAPSWKTNAIQRTYDIIREGGNGIEPIIKFHYLEGLELNGNAEDNLVFWGYISEDDLVFQLGNTNANIIQNWVQMIESIDYAPTTFGTNIWTLANRSIYPKYTWQGGKPGGETDWNQPLNWVGADVPVATSNVLIPSGCSYYPILPAEVPAAVVARITIQSGAEVNGDSQTLTVTGDGDAWFNNGNFIAGTGKVVFDNTANAYISGITSFNDLELTAGSVLINAASSIISIAGTVTNNGTWRTVYGGTSTVEYNGGNQTVVVPNSATNRYYNLILGGTGIKTMPVTALEIVGDFTLSGTASVTMGNNLTFSGNVILESGTTFNASTYTHQIKKNWNNTGATFQAATSTLNFNGVVAQTMTNYSGVSPYNLIISNNLAPVTLGISTDCSIGGNLTVNANSVFNLSTNSLTAISGSVSNSGTIKTISTSNTPLPSGKTWTGKVEFAASSAQTIVAGTFNNLLLSGTGGLTSTGDLTVNGILTLSSANPTPTPTKGLLDMASYTLTMGGTSSTIGQGDVTGIVKRTSIVANTTYTFGNELTSVNFPDIGTLPSVISLKIVIGSAPTWKPGAIKRILEITQTGGSGTQAILKVHYQDNELNGNIKSNLVNWVWFTPSTIIEYGRSDNFPATNVIETTNVNIEVFYPNFGMSQIGLANAAATALTWNGSVSSSWVTAQNWTPMASPSFLTTVTIPSGTPNNLSLPVKAECNKIIIKSGSIINTQANAVLHISGGVKAWENLGGTFNYGTSQICFYNVDASISGSTDFYDLRVIADANLTPEPNANIGIYGSIVNLGRFHPYVNINTVEYKGNNQTVVIPNPAQPKYSTLILSGTGVKTMPSSSLTVAADFSMAGSTIATSVDPFIVSGNFTLNGTSAYNSGEQLDVGGNMTINSGSSMNGGGFNHNITGNWINNGSFDAATSAFDFIGSSIQTIGGNSITIFNDFEIDNSKGLTLNTGTQVNGLLTLSSGLINTGTNILTIGDDGDIGGASTTSYINGKLARQFDAADSKVFPIGKGGVYRPLTVEYTSLTGTTTITAEQFETAMTGTLPPGTSFGPPRYWTITESGGSGTYNLTLDATSYTYLPLEPKILKKDGTIVAYPAAELDGNFTSIGITGSGDFAIGKGYLDSPDEQASDISFSNVTYKSFDIDWTVGTGESRAVFMKAGSGAVVNPINGATYAASSNWSSKGTQLGSSGYFCIYNGSDNMVSMTNLLPTTTYTVQVFEYNGSGTTSSYQVITATDNPNSQLTLNDPSIADYRSKTSGNYNAPDTWEYNTTGSDWDDATLAPSAKNNVYILTTDDGDHEVTLTANASLNLGKTIDISGTLICNSNRIILGLGNLTLQSTGTLKIASPTGSSGNITLTGTVDISNGTVELNGTVAQTQTARTFGNLIINNSLGVTLFGAIEAIGVTDDLTLTTGTLTTGTNTLTLSGNSPTRTSGTINASSGTLAFTNSTAITLPPSLFTGNINNLTINGAGGVTLGDATKVTGLLALTAGVLTTEANTLTLSGSSPTKGSGTIDASIAGATMAFTNAIAITLPASIFTGNINNLTLNGAGGITLGSDVSVNAVLALTSGILTTGVNSLTLGSSANFTDGSSTSFINGKLARIFSSTGSKTFPIGKGGNYRPLTFNYTSLSGTSTVTAEQIETIIPGTLPANSNAINRYWTLSQTGGSAVAFKVTLDGTGWSPSRTANMLKGDGSTNNPFNVTTPNYTSSADFTTFGNFSLAEGSVSWNGSFSNDWFIASNWSSATIPTPNDYIIVPSSLITYPTISGTSPAKDITLTGTANLEIQNGATLTLEAGPVLTLASEATVTTTGTGKIILKSDASYLNLSSTNPTLEVQHQLTGNKGWRMVASPVITTYEDMFAGFITQGFAGSTYDLKQPNLLWFNETDGGTTLQGWRQPSNITDNITGGRGHYHYVFNGAGITDGGIYGDALPITMSATGTEYLIPGSQYIFDVTRTDRATSQTPPGAYIDVNSSDAGWNLLGNPTASTLYWNATGWIKTNLDNTIYIWSPLVGEFLTWNGSTGTLGNGKIAPYQAFWVRANSPFPVLQVNNDAKLKPFDGQFLKQANLFDNMVINLSLSTAGQETRSFISFSENGITGSDPMDAYRLEPLSDTWLELYTFSSTSHKDPLVINNQPPIAGEIFYNLPLFVGGQSDGSGLSGSFTLQWELPANWPADWEITLHDHTLGKIIMMEDQDSYNFEYTSASKKSKLENADEFTLPESIVKQVSSQSYLKSSSPLQSYSIIIQKRQHDQPSEYIALIPRLIGNYPNPFISSTTFKFSLPLAEQVKLSISDIFGKHIALVADKVFETGVHELNWQNPGLSSGIYLLRLQTPTGNDVIKINIMN